MSQPLVLAGEPEVTRLRHTELPLATGSGLRSAEEVEGVRGQEDGGSAAAGRFTFPLLYLCFLDVCSAGGRSKPANNGRNRGAVYCVGLVFGVWRGLGRVSFPPPPDGCGGPRVSLSAVLSLPGWLSGEP